MQKGRYLLLSLIALGSIPSSLAQNAETTGDKNAHHIIVPLVTKSLSGVVSGDPSKPGAQYVIRMCSDANFIVLPHWHPEDEHITVVKGTMYLGVGDVFDRKVLRKLTVGDYALMPGKMVHFAWSETESIGLIHGIGPFKIISTDPQQSLSNWTLDPQKGLFRGPQSGSYFKFRLNDRVRSDRGEGVIAYGQHSGKNKVTQYTVQRGDGTRFFETEENLRALPSPPKPNSGPLTGTWEGVMYGLPQGDLSFTAIFEQEGEKISGVLAFFFGGAAFKSSAFRNKELELHMDTPLANFVLKAEYMANGISGRWSTDEGSNGTWECKKVIEGASVH